MKCEILLVFSHTLQLVTQDYFLNTAFFIEIWYLFRSKKALNGTTWEEISNKAEQSAIWHLFMDWQIKEKVPKIIQYDTGVLLY